MCEHKQYLHTLEQKGHDVASGDQLVHMTAKTLGQTAEQIQSHDHEVFIWSFILIRLLTVHLTHRHGRVKTDITHGREMNVCMRVLTMACASVFCTRVTQR